MPEYTNLPSGDDDKLRQALFLGRAREQQIVLRDQFAMAALQGLLASCDGPAWGKDVFPLAGSAYAYADQMMAERNKQDAR